MRRLANEWTYSLRHKQGINQSDTQTDRQADILVTVNQIDIKAKNAKEGINSASDSTEQVEYSERSFFTVIWNTSKAVAKLILKKDKITIHFSTQ